MKISTTETDDVSIVIVTGRVDSAVVPDLEVYLRALVGDGKSRIVLDLQEVEHMSSGGLRVMVSTLKAVRAAGGDLRLCNLSSRVEDVMHMAGLLSIFNIYRSQAEAVGSF